MASRHRNRTSQSLDVISQPQDAAGTEEKCGSGFEADDVILLNGDKDEVEELRKKMEDRRLKAKMQKKSKKPKATESAASNGETTTVSSGETTAVSNEKAIEGAPGPSKILNGNKYNPKDKITFVSSTESKTLEKSSTSSGIATKRPNPNDKSEAYKSIFTSHSSAKRTKDQSSNWVTHTAYYF